MAKATGRKAADTETKAKKKPAATTKASATTRKPVAKKPAAKKPAAKKPAVKKVVKKALAPKKTAATKARTPAKATKPVTTVKSRTRKPSAQPQTVATTVESPARKSAAKPAAVAATSAKKQFAAKPAAVAATGAKKQAAVRARRPKSEVLEVSPAVIDTTSAAEVAARLVIDAHGPAPLAPSPLGNLFDAPPVVAVKRGSSAFRHVKESLNKPVARQLEGVFGPAPVPPETMRRFLKGEKTSRTQRGRGTGNLHLGQSSVPHRSVG